MKIAHVLWGFTSGGIETMLVDIVEEQVKHADVAVFVINDKVEQALVDKLDSKCKLYLYRRKEGSKNPLPIIKYNFQLFAYNADIIHFHYIQLVKMTMSLKPKVITIHNAYSDSGDFDRYNKIYAISEAVNEYIKSKGFESVTVENGIRVKNVSVRKSQSTQGRKLRFVQVGRLYHQHKGQHIMLEALNVLVNEKGFTNFSLDFIGDGESNGYLHELVCQYGLNEYVNFSGTRSRDYIYSHLKDYDICFQPSVSEGFGLTVAEAMSAKVPVMVSDVPGTMEVIADGKYGFFFKAGDSHDLAEKIIEAIPLLDTYSDMLDEAWEYVYKHYDVSMTARNYMEEYKKLLTE